MLLKQIINAKVEMDILMKEVETIKDNAVMFLYKLEKSVIKH